MVRLDSERDGWSSVRDPETDEDVSLDEDVDPEVAERLADHYGELSIAEDDADAADADAEGDMDVLDELLAGTVPEVEAELEEGGYDDRLDGLEARADRQGVQDAVADRRDTDDSSESETG